MRKITALLFIFLLMILPSGFAVPAEDVLAYFIDVDTVNQVVTVYEGEGRETEDIVHRMICSTGEEEGDTPLGSFNMIEEVNEGEREEWYYIKNFQLYVQWPSRIVRDILFHSLPYEEPGAEALEEERQALGTPASHGCIRLRSADARWIAQNCPVGTEVYIHDDAQADEELRTLLLLTSFDREAMSYDEFLNGKLLLSQSSEGYAVLALQRRLNALGYEAGEENALFGVQTETALLAWQNDNGYEADGVLTPEQSECLREMTEDSRVQVKEENGHVIVRVTREK